MAPEDLLTGLIKKYFMSEDSFKILSFILFFVKYFEDIQHQKSSGVKCCFTLQLKTQILMINVLEENYKKT